MLWRKFDKSYTHYATLILYKSLKVITWTENVPPRKKKKKKPRANNFNHNVCVYASERARAFFSFYYLATLCHLRSKGRKSLLWLLGNRVSPTPSLYRLPPTQTAAGCRDCRTLRRSDVNSPGYSMYKSATKKNQKLNSKQIKINHRRSDNAIKASCNYSPTSYNQLLLFCHYYLPLNIFSLS